ncbi:MAG TPA: glucokinase [Thermoanaerobaculia bacterium]|nr:glucokinase [Thermoanaerobaculia bacterium]
MRIIGGDVGGTKTLLRCVESNGEISAEARFESAKYSTFEALLREFLGSCPGVIDAACFAVAGPVLGTHAEVTNVGWRIDAGDVGIERVALINDFYAIALGVPLLGDADVLSIHPGKRERTAPIAILGAGTGLGEAIVAHYGTEWVVIPTEGGHADFAPQDEEQARLYLHLRERLGGHVSWERVLSGMGLVNIFTFLGGPEIKPKEIAELAANGDARAVHTFDMFVDIYGAEAGNMALRILARGGVFLAGGIAAKNVARFTDGKFVTAFLRKGRFHAMLDAIPVDLITNEKVGLIGAVEGARRMLR